MQKAKMSFRLCNDFCGQNENKAEVILMLFNCSRVISQDFYAKRKTKEILISQDLTLFI